MFDETRPIYRQIEEQIKTEILSGTIAADEQVMSTNQYASFYRINPATAQKAFQNLTEEGLLYKRRGMGMFVAPGAREQLANQLRSRFFQDVLEPAIAQAKAVGISQSEFIEHVRQQWQEDEL